MDNTERIYLMWKTYEHASPAVRKQILAEFSEEIEGLPPKEFVKAFKDTPEDVLLEYLPEMDSDLQVLAWKTVVPVSSRAAARKLLKQDALVKLKLAPDMQAWKRRLDRDMQFDR